MTQDPRTGLAPRILIVDDEPSIRLLLAEVVSRAGYLCQTAQDGREAEERLAAESYDVVVTDIRMPHVGGLDLVRHIREHCDCDVVVMTGFAERYEYERIIATGAAEFIQKPCRPAEFITRLRKVLRARTVRLERDRAATQLARSHAELREAYLDTIRRLSVATEFKDVDTGAHIERIGRLSALLAETLGLGVDAVDSIRYAAPMHDVGKIGIPDTILLKRGALTAAEFEVMKSHTVIGGQILASPTSTILTCAREIVMTHHECWDGSGYPHGLAGTAIPIVGRIVKLADVFDALVSIRPYKQRYPLAVAIDLVTRGASSQFDPDVVAAFLDRLDDVTAIQGAGSSPTTFAWSERDLKARTASS